MIENPTKSNSKNPKKLDVQCQKSKKVRFLDFCWICVGLLDWIELN
jgi:hypothetical protein